MASSFPLNGSDYYDTLPPSGHSPGDIWLGFPCYDLFGTQTVRVLITTPACDLANRKVETVTYLPIIPVLAYFGTMAFVPEVMRTIRQYVDLTKCTPVIGKISATGYELPSDSIINTILQWSKERLNSTSVNLSGKKRTHVKKLHAAAQIALECTSPNIDEVPIKTLRDFFGDKELTKRLERLCRNAGPSDVHFLPSDGQPSDYSAVPVHSLVLFRYALTLPVSVLDMAQHSFDESDWKKTSTNNASRIPAFKHVCNKQPLRLARLRDVYWSDLLTRYITMHIRLGSPDFSSNRITSFVSDLGALKI